MNEWLLVAGVSLAASSGLPGLMLPRSANAGQRLAALVLLAGAGLGFAAALRVFIAGPGPGLAFAWPLPGAEVSIHIDPLSAAFLLPLFLISAAGAVYELEYRRQTEHPRHGRGLRLSYGLLTAGLALLLASRNGVLFLVSWEVMTLSAFFAMTAEDEHLEVRQAGWIYFASTHVSTLILVALFALYYAATGSLDLDPRTAARVSPGLANALFALALAGFGLKAGLFPLHFWLPPAHASAPSHVSALMSGVLIKMGVYGILRVAWLFPAAPPWWGTSLLTLGCVSGLLGVAFAIGQHDLKRLLAYHSIENIGIIFMGLGLAMAGRALGRSDWVMLGLAGGLLHVWNHGLFKALLFLAAGSAIHATGTREIDRLGGLAKGMPWTALCFLIGAVAICGLPPLNGFVSELLIYIGLFTASGAERPWAPAPFAVPVLALIGALALACFVKVHGAVFLGLARSREAELARESGPAVLFPMALLAGSCALIGLAPLLAAPALEAAVGSWAPELGPASPQLAQLAPLGWLSGAGASLLAALGLAACFLRRRGPAPAASPGTWDCGYARPSPAMQYTASSFGATIVRLFDWVLLSRKATPGVKGFFPGPASFRSDLPDIVLDRALAPTLRGAAWVCSWFRLLQRGKLNAYLLYIFLVLLVLLLCN